MLFLLACTTSLEDLSSYVDEARVLAVRATPAEAAAGETIQLEALYADASGRLDVGNIGWSFCMSPRPLAELGPVATSCLDPESPDLLPISEGLEVTATLPNESCSLFGPNPPPPQEGEPSGRPADPDVTGGYYQPVLGFDDEQPILSALRVRCGLASVTQEIYVEWNSKYISNTAPLPTVETPSTVTPSGNLTLNVSWPECAESPCEGAETYVVYDPDTKTLLSRREALSVTYFATGGQWELARNGRSGDEMENSITNTWTAPESGEITLWIVLRDERGGVGFTEQQVTVTP